MVRKIKYVMPVCVFLMLSGCGGQALDEAKDASTFPVKENAYVTALPLGAENEDTSSELENLTIQGLYYKLGEEIGFGYLGGMYYDADADVYGMWLKQEAYDERENRELTACELALEQAVEDGHLNIRIGKYSTQELSAFQNQISSLMSENGIFATGLNEVENKVSVYVNEEMDFSELYELVPEDAVLIQYILGPVEFVDL